jgi:hypothetical protein
MQTILVTISQVLLAPLVAVLTFAGYNVSPHFQYDEQIDNLQNKVETIGTQVSYFDSKVNSVDRKVNSVDGQIKLGSTYSPTGGGTYRLQSSIGTTDTTIKLSSFKEPVSNIAYTMTYLNTAIAYGTLDPQQSTRSEFVSFTGITQNSDGTATLTGVSRGMSRSYPYTASTTLRQTHSGQSIFILSDSPQHFSEYAVKRNDEDITGDWKVPTPANSTSIANRAYVDGAAFGGIGNASETATGTVQLATGLQAASSTSSGTLGRLVIPASLATSTYNTDTAALRAVITQNDGKIDDYFIATTTLLNPVITIASDLASTTITGTTTISTCRNCTNTTVYVPATQFASTSIAALGALDATNGTVGSATTTYWFMKDNASSGFGVSTQVPKAVTQLTGIKLIHPQTSTGDLQFFMITSYASSTYPTTATVDSTAGVNYTTTGTADQRIQSITLSTTGHDAITSVKEGGVVNLQVSRNGSTGGDTYNANLQIYGVEFIFN